MWIYYFTIRNAFVMIQSKNTHPLLIITFLISLHLNILIKPKQKSVNLPLIAAPLL